jgi:hypothetical protein
MGRGSDEAVANGQQVILESAVGTIVRFGALRRIEFLVTRDAKPLQKPVDPVLLLGGGLFSTDRLILDYTT